MSATLLVLITAALTGGAVSAIIAGLFARQKTKAETNGIIMSSAKQAFEMMEAAYKDRIKTLELDRDSYKNEIVTLKSRVTQLESEREVSNRTIGTMMRAAEAQSKNIMVLREHVDELLEILRRHGIELPAWAEMPVKGDGG